MKVTINDVAKQAGVSIKTVSRVMNNEPSVRPDTVARVQQVINQLHYQPNAAARNLAGSRSYNVAYVYDNPNAYYIIDMQKGLLEACRQHGYELLIHPANSASSHIIQELKDLISRSRLAGLVLTPPFSEMPQLTEALTQQGVAFVSIMSGSASASRQHNCIMIDDYSAAYQLTSHLLEQGHTDIAFLCGDAGHQSSTERLKGYKAALQQQNIALKPQYILPGSYSFESGVQRAQQLLQQAERPTAIFACNDEIAAGALFSARLLQLDIPQQLSIVGFENSPFSRQTWPPLTTADQPNSQIAQQAAELLFRQIRQSTPSDTPAPVFTPDLLLRQSTGTKK